MGHDLRQPRLADAARPGQRDRVRRAEQPFDLGEFAVSSDKAGELDRQRPRHCGRS
jgi:hypothetical protein